MKGSQPVELYHQCSGYVINRLESLDGKRRTGNEVETDVNRKKAEALVEKPIVWADTGTATEQYRYYLAKADLQKLNSQLDITNGEYSRDYTVEILKDDPVKKIQTIQVIIWSGSRYASVYNVENNRIRPPLMWSRLSDHSGIALPFVLAGTGCFWGFVIWLAKLIYKRRINGLNISR